MPSAVFRSAALAAAVLASASGAALGASLPNQVASGEVSRHGARLWARAGQVGTLTFEWATDASFTNILGVKTRAVVDAMKPAQVSIGGLSDGATYYYRATDSAGDSSVGEFTTAAAGGRRGFRMGVSGDWRGELAGFPAVRNVPGADLDLWVSLGDTIYADVPSPAVPAFQAQTLAEFRAKHNEVYAERFGVNTLADLRSSVAILAQIDDHEVTNDFAGGAHPSTDPKFAGQPGDYINETPLYLTGVQAFREFNPMRNSTVSGTGDDRLDGAPDLYRQRRFGQDAAVFSLDARSFRDEELPGVFPTNPAGVQQFLEASFTPGRTMVGAKQLGDLKAGLLAAEDNGVTWKFVMVPEPIQNLGVLGASDRFEGYAAERTEILRFINDNDIDNVVFIAADIHGTVVNNLTYQESAFGPQITTNAFEITTGSVAYDAPFGPTVAAIAFALGMPDTLDPLSFLALPLTDREAYIQGLLNSQLDTLGYDSIGLDGSGIDAELLQGAWTATNTFGWTDFDIDPLTQQLTVTTWGVHAYNELDLLADPDAVMALEPFIVQQFVVNPVPAPGGAALLAALAWTSARRRR